LDDNSEVDTPGALEQDRSSRYASGSILSRPRTSLLRTFSLSRFTARWYGYRVHSHFQRCPDPLTDKTWRAVFVTSRPSSYPSSSHVNPGDLRVGRACRFESAHAELRLTVLSVVFVLFRSVVCSAPTTSAFMASQQYNSNSNSNNNNNDGDESGFPWFL
jgi:hypothetical protein